MTKRIQLTRDQKVLLKALKDCALPLSVLPTGTSERTLRTLSDRGLIHVVCAITEEGEKALADE